MKARAVVRMAERALDQVAQVILERDGHCHYKFKGGVDHSEKEKPTDATRNTDGHMRCAIMGIH